MWPLEALMFRGWQQRQGRPSPSLGWAVVGQRRVVVRIIILSARTRQDVVDPNFPRRGAGTREHGERFVAQMAAQPEGRDCAQWGVGSEGLAPPPRSDLGRSSRTSQSLSLLMCRVGMLMGHCEDTIRNGDDDKISLSINARKFSFLGMSIPVKRAKAKARSLLHRVHFIDDSLLCRGVSETLGFTGFALLDCLMGCFPWPSQDS